MKFSPFTAELALQVNGEEFEHFLGHVTNWRYVKGFFREFKALPRGKDLNRFLDPIIVLHEEGLIQCSCVYLDKQSYTGPYLKTNPLRFRNFVHRKLLEFHFGKYTAKTNDLEIVFDRFDLSADELNNLDSYLKNNWKLPRFKHITHIDSIYCEADLTPFLVPPAS